MQVYNVNTDEFNRLIKESDKPVLVDFWAPWCGYCRRIDPAMSKIGEQYGDSLEVVKVNIDEDGPLADSLGVELIPTLIIFRGGERLGSIVAPDSKARIEAFIKENLG